MKNLHNTLKLFRHKNLTKRKGIKNPSLEDYAYQSPLKYPKDGDQNKIILLQTILKGRSVQKMIEKGVKNFKSVIEDTKKEMSKFITNQKPINIEMKQIEKRLKNDLELQEALKAHESKKTKKYFSSLERELQRLQSEKRAHALYLLAERERYYREASKFMDEDQLEETFKNDDVVLYLENCLLEGLNSDNEETSRQHIRDLIRKIDQVASMDFSSSQEISRKNSFEAEKDQIRPNRFGEVFDENLRSRQKIILQEIHEEIFKEEFLDKEIKEREKFCRDLINEVIEKACETVSEIRSQISRQDSIEAEQLASMMVEKILNELNTSSSTSVNGTEETESSSDKKTEVLVEKVLLDVLDNVTDTTSSDA